MSAAVLKMIEEVDSMTLGNDVFVRISELSWKEVPTFTKGIKTRRLVLPGGYSLDVDAFAKRGFDPIMKRCTWYLFGPEHSYDKNSKRVILESGSAFTENEAKMLAIEAASFCYGVLDAIREHDAVESVEVA